MKYAVTSQNIAKWQHNLCQRKMVFSSLHTATWLIAEMKTNTASGSGFSIYQAFPAPESQLDLFQYWTIHTYTALQRTKKNFKGGSYQSSGIPARRTDMIDRHGMFQDVSVHGSTLYMGREVWPLSLSHVVASSWEDQLEI